MLTVSKHNEKATYEHNHHFSLKNSPDQKWRDARYRYSSLQSFKKIKTDMDLQLIEKQIS